MNKLDYAAAQLRHAYKILLSGQVRDTRQFAIGLIGPAIRRIEQHQTAGYSSRHLPEHEQTNT